MTDPLSIVGAVAACQQIIVSLTKVVKALAVAEKEQASMVLRLNHQAILLRSFSELVASIELEIDSDYRNHFNIVLKHMHLVLETTLMKMEKISKKKSSKLGWVLAGSDLRDSEKELFDWSQRLMVIFAFTPAPLKTKFVEKLSATQDADTVPFMPTGLTANIRMEKGKNSVAAGSIDQITSNKLLAPMHWDSVDPEHLKKLWIDRIKTDPIPSRGPMSPDEVQLEVGRLYAVLKHADALSNRILTAEHFLVTEDLAHRFAIASSLPQETCKRQLLSDMLVEPSQHPLDHRIRVALEFITAIAYVHAVGWVHKAVRPNNILMLHSYDDVEFPHGLGHAFLVGFEYARRGTGPSTGSGHWNWKEDIYRHPDRQNKDGIDLEIYYNMKYDIYSAGVVLLELGTWTSLVRDCPGLKLADPDERRRLLLDYCAKIPGAMGSRYAALVKKCIGVDYSGIDVQQLLTEVQEFRL